MNVDNGNLVFDFNTIIKFFKIHRLKIIVSAVLGVLISLIIANFVMTPKYSSNIDILVNQKIDNQQVQYNIQQADLQAINTYKDVLKKPIILNDVLKQLREEDNYKGSLADLQNALSVTNETNSQVITVTAESTNPYVARDMANIVGRVFTKKIKNLMQIDNVTIVSSAQVETQPVSPNKKMIVVLGFIIGLVVGIVIGLIKELMKTTVDDVSYLTDDLGLTNLGSVYHIKNDKKGLRVVKIIEVDDPEDQHRRI